MRKDSDGPIRMHVGVQPLFDDLVGAREKGLRHREAERLRGLQVDHQLEVRRLLHREIGRSGAAQQLRELAAEQPVNRGETRTVGNQPTVLRRLWPLIDAGSRAATERSKIS